MCPCEPRAQAGGATPSAGVSSSLIWTIWVWVKIQPPGIGPQVLVHVSIDQGKPFWGPIFDPQPSGQFGAGARWRPLWRFCPALRHAIYVHGASSSPAGVRRSTARHDLDIAASAIGKLPRSETPTSHQEHLYLADKEVKEKSGAEHCPLPS